MELWEQSLHVQRHLAHVQIQEIENYSRAIESLLSAEAQRIADELERQAATLPVDVRGEYYAYNAENYQDFRMHFPNRLRLTLISAAHSALEDRVLSVCSMLQSMKKIELSLRDLAGRSSMGKAQLYLSKVLILPIAENIWKPLEPYNKIRNLIAHADGYCSNEPTNSSIRAFILSQSAISLDPLSNIIVTPKFLSQYISVIRDFYAGLFTAGEAWMQGHSTAA